MDFSPRFREGVRAAIPIWIAFVPSSLAFGVAAQAHGLQLGEVVLMSAWVYSGPAQFTVLAPIAAGKSSLQILLAASLVNLRFLPMSTALAPYFRGVRPRRLLVVDMRGVILPLICLVSLVATVPAMVLSPDWGWIATAIIVATVGWSVEQWMKRA